MIDDSKKPLLFAFIVAGLAATVSLPLSYIVGTVTTIAFGTVHDTVGAGDVTFGIIAGVVTTLFFVAYTSYATYSFSKAKYVKNSI